MKKTFTIVLLSLAAFYAHSQSVAQTRCDNLHQGVNLSNWLESYWAVPFPPTGNYGYQFLADMKAAGISSVRLPVCFALITDSLPPYTVDTTSGVFPWIDSVIQWTAALDMNLIIDNHHEWFLADSAWRNSTPRLAHLWSVLAQRYSGLNPNRYFFEIMNEPNNIPNDSLNIMFNTVIDTIRQYAPNHSIVIGPTAWSGGVAYIGYQPLADTNLIYTFHSYDPIQFTHQGFTWFSPYEPTGTTYPNSGYDFLLTLAWGASVQWRDSFHLPLFLGEFGVGRYADSVSRCNWMDTVGHNIDQYHMPAFNWDVKYDFYLWHSGATQEDSVVPCFMQYLHLYGDTVSGINNLRGVENVHIYPNPALQQATIDFTALQPDNITINIYDMQGRLAGNQAGSLPVRPGYNALPVRLNGLCAGTYIVSITGLNTAAHLLVEKQ